MPTPKKDRAWFINHARERFLLRYGRELEIEQYWAMVQLIRKKKSFMKWKSSRPQSEMHLLKIGTEGFVAVFYKPMAIITTFLPATAAFKRLLLKATEPK